MDKAHEQLSLEEVGILVSILAKEYNKTIPSVLHKLDAVSGDLNALHRLLSGDRSAEWTREEDDLLSRNTELLKKWKGNEQSELRKKYLSYKVK